MHSNPVYPFQRWIWLSVRDHICFDCVFVVSFFIYFLSFFPSFFRTCAGGIPRNDSMRAPGIRRSTRASCEHYSVATHGAETCVVLRPYVKQPFVFTVSNLKSYEARVTGAVGARSPSAMHAIAATFPLPFSSRSPLFFGSQS